MYYYYYASIYPNYNDFDLQVVTFLCPQLVDLGKYLLPFKRSNQISFGNNLYNLLLLKQTSDLSQYTGSQFSTV